MWLRLAEDMHAVADTLSLSRYIAAGNSMGAATALCAGLQRPERVAGLIIYRPPLIWEARQARHDQLVAWAKKLQASHPPGWSYYEAVRGAAECNLPPISDARWTGLRSTPILILCHGEDAIHPVSSGTALKSVLPHARLEVAADEASARAEFPAVVAGWLRGVLAVLDEPHAEP